MKKEIDELKNAKTFKECAKIIYGINYTNGKIQKSVIDYCFENYSIDIVSIMNNNKKNYCLNCGKEIKNGKKFCNSSCAAKYNNKNRKLTEETKKKISNSLKRPKKEKIQYECVCLQCGNTFLSQKQDAKYCSSKCSNSSSEVKEKMRQKVRERISNGTFSGWKSRNIKSYAEIFFESVLINNDIKFVREDFSTKKYFLDFLIEKKDKKIDLEIDGKQHSYEDRIIHDKERDEFLTKNGYIVYRIPWNEIKSEKGKLTMKEKIKKFIEFYNSL